MYDLKKKILVVDDMAMIRKLVNRFCKEIGFIDFVDAADGNAAWEALVNANPPVDIIISDWNMPGCTGYELLVKVRADARFKNLPFFMLTAESEENLVKSAIEAGVSSYIVKPFTKESIIEKLEAVHKKTGG
jgi:two-component system chemotaxis response regulator CheY